MIRHLFKLIWNRRRANALVVTEIFVCFLVLFAVTTFGLYSVRNYFRPLGFDYSRVFKVDLEFDQSLGRDGRTSRTGASATEPVEENPHESRQRALLSLLKSDPSVEEAAWGWPLPFSHSNEVHSSDFRGRSVSYSLARVTDEYQRVLGIEITRGRWFSPEDAGSGYEAFVITEALAKQAFGDEDPVGKSFAADRNPGEAPPEREPRVVGVMRAFHQEGEMDTEENYALIRLDYASRRMGRTAGIALRMRGAADAAVEARLAKALQAAAPDWGFTVEPLEMGAELNRRMFMAPIAVGAVVAFSLILMVALGLSGVLWQSVTTRIREIGVRRALGASAGDVRNQVVGELLVMATVAMGLGVIVVLQFPFLDLLGPVPKGVFFAGLSLTIVSLYALALLCSLQPARLATSVHPAEALRYE